MQEEYNFTLTVPLDELGEAEGLLDEARASYPQLRLTRKPDRGACARFYLSFPYTGARTDLRFQEWFVSQHKENWDLFGPNYGIWGLA